MRISRQTGGRAAASALLAVALAASIVAVSTPAQAADPDCTIFPTVGDDLVWGTDGDDVICVGGGDYRVAARKGRDTVIVTGPGRIQINLGPGPDVVDARLATSVRVFDGPDDDTIVGSSGDDEFFTHSGADQIDGGPGDDYFSQASNPARLEGGPGNDRMRIFGAADAHGGDGDDDIAVMDDGVIAGDAGNDQLLSWRGPVRMEGGPGDDNLVVEVSGGADVLLGGDGNDILRAGGGRDTLEGGPGRDYCELDPADPLDPTCVYDIEGPRTTASFAQDVVDVRAGPVTTQLTIRLTDKMDPAGATLVCLLNRRVSLADYVTARLFDVNVGLTYTQTPELGRLDYVSVDGVRTESTVVRDRSGVSVTFPVTVPATAVAGTYSCLAYGRDSAGNLGNTLAPPVTSLRVLGPGDFADKVFPIARAFPDPRVVDVTDGDAATTVRFQVTDNLAISEVSAICVFGRGSWTLGTVTGGIAVEGSPTRKIATFPVTVPRGTPPGLYSCGITGVDAAGNRHTDGALIRVVRRGTGWDDAAPTIRAEVDRSAETRDGDDQVILTVTVADTTAVDRVQVSCGVSFGAVWSRDRPDVVQSGPTEILGVVTATPTGVILRLPVPVPAATAPGLRSCSYAASDGRYERRVSSDRSGSNGPYELTQWGSPKDVTGITVTRTAPGVPTAPRDITWTASTPTSGILSWSAPFGAAVTRYDVILSTNRATWTALVPVPADAPSVARAGLKPGTDYWVRVRARDGATYGTWSLPTRFRTPPAVAPSAPAVTAPVVSATKAGLAWARPESGGATITDYRVSVSRDGGSTWTPVTRPRSVLTTVTLSGLSPGRDYLVRVSAVNAVGVGAAGEVAFTTPSG